MKKLTILLCLIGFGVQAQNLTLTNSQNTKIQYAINNSIYDALACLAITNPVTVTCTTQNVWYDLGGFIECNVGDDITATPSNIAVVVAGDYYVYYSGSVEASGAGGQDFEMCVFRDAQQGWPSLSSFTLSNLLEKSCVGGNQVPPANATQVFSLKYRCTSGASKKFTIDNMAFGICLQRATE